MTFTASAGPKRTTLAVERLALVQAGPNTVATLDSPATVEVTEVRPSSLRGLRAAGIRQPHR